MRKATGSYRTYSNPGKTAALVPEFAVEDLPSAELQPGSCACSGGPALGQNTDDEDIYIIRGLNLIVLSEKLVFLVLLCSHCTAYIVRDNAKTFTSVGLSLKCLILFAVVVGFYDTF